MKMKELVPREEGVPGILLGSANDKIDKEISHLYYNSKHYDKGKSVFILTRLLTVYNFNLHQK